MLHLEWPWLLATLPLPWFAWRLLPPAAKGGGGVAFLPITEALQQAGGGTPDRPQRPLWLRLGAILGWVLLVLAASRPQWLGEPIELPESGRNLMLAVDVSGSMGNTDLEASGGLPRLELVKQVAGEFIRRREGDRIGLILFGSQAYLQAPLTLDRLTVAELLDAAAVGIAGRQTAIGDAIGTALKHLASGEGEAVLILLTDGANTAGHVSPRKAAELAARKGLKVYTIGVGGQARHVRGPFGSRLLLPNNELDEGTLKDIARITGGRYFRAGDRAALESIYRELDQLEPVLKGSQVLRPVDELYVWPLGAALLLSLLLAGGVRLREAMT